MRGPEPGLLSATMRVSHKPLVVHQMLGPVQCEKDQYSLALPSVISTALAIRLIARIETTICMDTYSTV
jgi:hypothetical protein